MITVNDLKTRFFLYNNRVNTHKEERPFEDLSKKARKLLSASFT